ncbi:MAG: hypothetical protein A2Z34_03640 [Planctomycetes bacterium RBG_16_59_8]|nr:MAG: hypothetical protein A2Z34_03640 [Planctomycetes bacterium RBG_16_59_8]
MRSADNGNTGLDDSCLLSGDPRQRFSQLVRVVVVDAGDADNRRRHHVRRIETPPKPNLDDRIFHAGAGEGGKGDRGHEIEIGRTAPRSPDGGQQIVRGGNKLPLANPSPHQLDPFPHIDEMGRRVEAGPEAGGPENPFDHDGGRSFSLGAGDVDDAKTTVRISRKTQEIPECIEIEVRPGVADPSLLLVVRRGVEEGAGFSERSEGAADAHSRLSITRRS